MRSLLQGVRFGVLLLAVGLGCSRREPVPEAGVTSLPSQGDGSSRAGLSAEAFRLLKDINPLGASANPRGLMNVHGTVFFTATDGVAGRELWKSDGSAAGTVLVKDIFPGVGSSEPSVLAHVNGTVFFSATDGVTGRELWKSDGTAAGTVLVKDIFPGVDESNPVSATTLNGTLYFTATDGSTGRELWKSDGSAAGTVLVKDINTTRYESSSPSGLTNVNGTLYFSASLRATDQELWKSDGSAAGTVLVKDIFPGSAGSAPAALKAVNGTLFFSAMDGVTGQELWKSDGSAAGTVLVKDIVPGPSSSSSNLYGSSPTELTDSNGTLYFNASDATTMGLWKSDGSAAGTVLVKGLRSGSSDYGPMFLTDVDGTPYFSGSDGVRGIELWKSDGTSAGTVSPRDIHPGTNSSAPSNPVTVNGTLFFHATDGVTGQELWKSDGSAAGTVLVKDIFPGLADSPSGSMVNINGTLYFTSRSNGLGWELWKSNGSAAGTVLVKDIFPGSENSSDPSRLTNVNGTLYFTATDGLTGQELWKSDGSAAGTVLVKDISPGTSASTPDVLTNINGTLYFTATDGSTGRELWKSDGTAAGTVLVKDIFPGTNGSRPYTLSSVKGLLYFNANDGVTGDELWRSDGTAAGTVLVKDIEPGAGSARPSYLRDVNGTLYFSATTGTNGVELWKSDGSAAGTVLVKDVFPGTGSSDPQPHVSLNGTLYFTATDGVTGRELWKSDGSAAGTVFLKDFFPGPGNGWPSAFPVGSKLFVSANTPLYGGEWWVMEEDSVPPGVTCPADQHVLATGASGARVTYPPATATDDQTATPRLTYSVESGSRFALGSTAVTVTALDDAGNTARCGFTVHVRPPAPTVSAPLDGTSSRAPVAVAGTALEGATVSAWEDITVLGTFTADASGAFSGSLALKPGVSSVRFTQTLGGATSDPTAARTVTVQPPAPALTRPAPGASVVGPTVRVEGTGVSGATAQVFEGNASVGLFAVEGPGLFAGSVTLAYGVHQLTAAQTAGGQWSPVSAPVAFEVRPPAPDVGSPAEGARVDGPKVAVTGSGVPGARVEVREGGAVLAVFTADASGGFSGEVALPPGTHALTFVQKAGGATSDVLGPRSVSVRPHAPVLTAPAAQARVPGPEVLLEGTAVAGARVLAEASGAPLGHTLADTGGAFRLRVTRPYGPQSLSLRQEVESVTGPDRLAEFTVIPASPVLSQPLDGATVGRELEVRGGAVPLARVTLREGTAVLATADADANGAFVMNVSLTRGPHTLTAVQRVQGEESNASAPVYLQAVFNRAPVADAQELSVAEDGRLAVTLTAHDPDGDALVFTVRTPPAHGVLEGTPPALTYVPGADFQGADRFTFAVSDGALEATASVRLTVTPVNDAPVATALTATTGEGQSIPLILAGTDVDGDRLSYEGVTGPAHGRLQGTPPEVTYTPVAGFAGADAFTFRVSDGQRQSPPATVSLRVVASTLTVSVSDLQPLEGSAVTFSAALSDASATPVFAWDFGDGTRSSEPTPRHVFPDDGVYTVGVSATDADGTRQASVLVTVRNAPPVVESFWLPEAVSEAQAVELSATALDPADSADTLEYLWNFGDGSPEARGARVRHAFRDDGAFTVVLTVRDEDGGEARAQAPLTVANVPPSATTPERQTLQVGECLSLQLFARDVARAADPLTWKKRSGPGAVTPEGLFTWVPAVEEVGESSVRLEVSDDEGGSAEVTLVVEVWPPYAVTRAGSGCGAIGGASGLFTPDPRETEPPVVRPWVRPWVRP